MTAPSDSPAPRVAFGAALHRPVAVLAAAAALAACSPHTVREDPQAPVKLRERFASEAPAVPAAEETTGPWWERFGDARLSALQHQALTGNFDLHAAWARLSQAEAGAALAGAPRWPQVNLGASGSSNRTVNAFPDGMGGTNVVTFDFLALRGSVAASYEVDVWDRLGSAARAATLDRAVAYDMVQSMAISVSAEVAEGYFNVVQSTQRRKVLEGQLEVGEQFYELLELRFHNGQETIVDVNQQQQQVLAVRAQLDQQQAAEEVQRHRLAVLLGKVPGELALEPQDALPTVPALPPRGLPSDLLKRRPDVRAAQRRVEAADERLAAAVAARYPQLTLTGELAVRPNELNDWLMQPFWNLAAGLAMPLIDGGRRAAEADRNRALLAERVADYGKAVLGAIVEVEIALSQERQQHAVIDQLRQQSELATVTLQQARERYSQGQSDFLTVLTALRSQQQTELALVDAQRALLSHRIQLHRALGGDWAAAVGRPQALEPTAGGDA